jgi:phosphomannomutase
MLKEDIYFAAESSGHFFLNDVNGCFEYPSIMILKLLTAFSGIDSSVADYVKQYKRYFSSGEINSSVKDKEIVFQKILTRYADSRINRLDGISVEYPDYWFNVRGSNTEPTIRLNLEAISPEIMEQKRDEVLNLIRE